MLGSTPVKMKSHISPFASRRFLSHYGSFQHPRTTLLHPVKSLTSLTQSRYFSWSIRYSDKDSRSPPRPADKIPVIIPNTIIGPPLSPAAKLPLLQNAIEQMIDSHITSTRKELLTSIHKVIQHKRIDEEIDRAMELQTDMLTDKVRQVIKDTPEIVEKANMRHVVMGNSLRPESSGKAVTTVVESGNKPPVQPTLKPPAEPTPPPSPKVTPEVVKKVSLAPEVKDEIRRTIDKAIDAYAQTFFVATAPHIKAEIKSQLTKQLHQIQEIANSTVDRQIRELKRDREKWKKRSEMLVYIMVVVWFIIWIMQPLVPPLLEVLGSALEEDSADKESCQKRNNDAGKQVDGGEVMVGGVNNEPAEAQHSSGQPAEGDPWKALAAVTNEQAENSKTPKYPNSVVGVYSTEEMNPGERQAEEEPNSEKGKEKKSMIPAGWRPKMVYVGSYGKKNERDGEQSSIGKGHE
ncbi:hypothetical protein EX30DRAFT_398856 [Ascodesmis nigricans]|uniref:Uncharacterized protein n=1 Tax=Ascodesmis nigricans TaxID=341454 RepID=A0A4V3SHP1_9PEZI|nr:hypothetical protein EX30DRAFT_398856 [Ascodesmis nigricans]